MIMQRERERENVVGASDAPEWRHAPTRDLSARLTFQPLYEPKVSASKYCVTWPSISLICHVMDSNQLLAACEHGRSICQSATLIERSHFYKAQIESGQLVSVASLEDSLPGTCNRSSCITWLCLLSLLLLLLLLLLVSRSSCPSWSVVGGVQKPSGQRPALIF